GFRHGLQRRPRVLRPAGAALIVSCDWRGSRWPTTTRNTNDGWRSTARQVPADLLPAHWARLDEFEGPGYRRAAIEVETPDGPVAASIYRLA
ncbi:MAG: hypothetical protein AAF531_22090, partial [Actinomycetota bacterium]